MRQLHHLLLAAALAGAAQGAPAETTTTATTGSTANPPEVVDSQNVTYRGLQRNNIEVFLGIPYGQDTSGANRFRPPRPAAPAPSTTVVAQAYGPACPQWYGPGTAFPPFTLDDYAAVSEDCLTLNVARPGGLSAAGGSGSGLLPVLVYIYGGSLITGQASDSTILPDGLILQAVAGGTPIIHVAMNYRLGFFGFAQTDDLQAEGSENAGFRDQRLALEWVRDHIQAFGGDPNKVTIYGQSSGGSSVGIQMLAYGGAKPAPFQQAIATSGLVDIGVTAGYTANVTQQVVDAVGCNTTTTPLACLRALDTATLLAASLAVYQANSGLNAGAIWLAAVDGDFVPEAPSALVAQRRFAPGVRSAVLGWMDDDLTPLTALGGYASVTTPEQTRAAVAGYAPFVTAQSLDALLALYPSADFAADPSAGLSAEFYRTDRIFRDAIMACQPLWYGAALAGAGRPAYLLEWNQTILDPIAQALWGLTGVGVFHTSEFAYVFGNLSHYDINGWPFDPSAADYALAKRAPRSWAQYVTSGSPSGGAGTFKGWTPAFPGGSETNLFVAGGPGEGLSPIDGSKAKPAVAVQKLRERCAFLTSPEIIEQLRY